MGKKIRLNITVEEIAFLIMWMVFFVPPAFHRISSVLSHAATLAGYGAFLLMFLFKRKEFPVKEDVMYVFAFLLYCNIIVLFKTPGEFPVYLRRYMIPAVESIFLVRWSLGGRKTGLRVLYGVTAFYITANFLSIILFREGMFRSTAGSSVERAQWLFGSKNNIPLYMILFITIAVYYYYTVCRTRMFYVLALMGAFSVLMSGADGLEFLGGSSTGIVAYFAVLMMIAYYLHTSRTGRAALGVKSVFIVTLIMNLILLTGQSIPGMEDLIVNVFHKNVTFSGRTTIWAANLRAVGEHLLLGHGEKGIMAHVLLKGEWVNTDYTYNFVLKLLMNYGIIGLGLFIWMILKITRGNETGDRLLFSGFIGLLIIGLMNEIEMQWLMLFPIMLTMYEHPLAVCSRSKKGRIKPERSLGLQIRF
ncbi:MAG TPA: hypothetical protein DCG37_05870 [Lachnospiraceae bacterium]|nr:hypothetical protein [Lachnospiraceae bacterium]